MKSRGELIICAIIIAAALIICTNKLVGTNLFTGNIRTSGSFGGNVSLSGNASKNDEVLSLYEAGGYLNMEPDDLEKLLKSTNTQEIPFFKVSDNYMFSKKALDEWIYNCSKASINNKP